MRALWSLCSFASGQTLTCTMFCVWGAGGGECTRGELGDFESLHSRYSSPREGSVHGEWPDACAGASAIRICTDCGIMGLDARNVRKHDITSRVYGSCPLRSRLVGEAMNLGVYCFQQLHMSPVLILRWGIKPAMKAPAAPPVIPPAAIHRDLNKISKT